MKTIKQLQEENAALMAQVDALKSRVGTAERVEAIFNQAPEISFDDCLRLFPDDLREIRAEAGRAGFVAAINLVRLNPERANHAVFVLQKAAEYADSIRKGEVE